jgi:hypothetical protein
VCVYSVCVVLCVGSGLATGSSPVQGVLPTVCKIKKLKKRRRSNKKTCKAIDRHRGFSINEGLWSRLCLNLRNYSETAVTQLNGRRPDHRHVQATYTCYAWLILVQYHALFDLHGSGLIVRVSYVI